MSYSLNEIISSTTVYQLFFFGKVYWLEFNLLHSNFKNTNIATSMATEIFKKDAPSILPITDHKIQGNSLLSALFVARLLLVSVTTSANAQRERVETIYPI